MTKIAFSGVSGGGKTSLLNEVKKIMSLKYKISSISDTNLKNPFDDDLKSSFISHFFYMTTQINEENIEMQKNHDILFCDRSILDQWIFWKSSLKDVEMNEKLDEKFILLQNLYKFWIKTYDLTFLIRINTDEFEKREQDTEFRTRNIDQIKHTENMFLESAGEDDLNIIEIWNTNTIDESAHKIIESISNHDLI
ncbi:MAG: AAA family ATPase [Acidobacteriota bacterium]